MKQQFPAIMAVKEKDIENAGKYCTTWTCRYQLTTVREMHLKLRFRFRHVLARSVVLGNQPSKSALWQQQWRAGAWHTEINILSFSRLTAVTVVDTETATIQHFTRHGTYATVISSIRAIDSDRNHPRLVQLEGT